MPTPNHPSDTAAGPSNAAGATGSRSERDPQQEATKTEDGVEFLHAGSGNTLGTGRTAGGSANVSARDALPDTNADDESKDDGSALDKGDPEARK